MLIVFVVAHLAAVASDADLVSRAVAAGVPDVPPRFDVVALGVQGGLAEDDLTSFLVARSGQRAYLALDAGTVLAGLRVAIARGAIDVDDGAAAGERPEAAVLRRHVKAWAITHPHLDHVAGLAHAVVEDTGRKPVFGLASTLDGLRAHLFNGVLWANFGDDGQRPLGRLRWVRLPPHVAAAVEGTGLTIEALPLSHAGMTSTAFLVGDGAAFVAFLGDTGPDLVEGGRRLDALWHRLAPLLRGGQLRAIFVEVSYDNARPDDALFGHLTPRHLRTELDALARLVDPQAPATALRRLTVVVHHVKPTMNAGPPARDVIARELSGGSLDVRIVLPRQGDRLAL